MRRQAGERGAALIMLIGITATLLILSVALVMLLVNQMHATADARSAKTSMYFAEAALDSGANAIKSTTTAGAQFPTSSTPAIDTSQMNTEYAVACPSPAPTPTYSLYDNADPVTTTTPSYDANGDHKLWVEAKVTYQHKTTRLRVMLSSDVATSILPKAVLYADTDIVANGTSDIYALDANGNQYTTAPAIFQTSVTAGGDITGGGSTNLAAPGQTAQSVGVSVNTSSTVSLPGVTNLATPKRGTVGLLSDYFDQYRQYTLTTEAQTGMDSSVTQHPDVTAPTAPTKPGTTYTSTKFTPTNMASIGATFVSGTKTYTIPSMAVSGNLTLDATTFPSGTIFNFSTLYVTSGTFNVTGNVTVSASTLYVGGAMTISGATSTITDSLGALYVTGAVSVSGSPAISTASASTSYVGGAFTHAGPAATAVTDSFGPLYVGGSASFSGTVNINSSTNMPNVHTGGSSVVGSVAVTAGGRNYSSAPTVSFSGGGGTGAAATATVSGGAITKIVMTATGSGYTSAPSVSFSGGGGSNATATASLAGFALIGPTGTSASVADTWGSVRSTGSIAVSGNVVADTSALYTGANFTISGNTASITDQFGPIYVSGTADWNSGSMSARLGLQTTSAATTAWADPTTPGPMFAQIFTIDGDTNGNYDPGAGPYDVVLGDVWVDGNAGTGDVAVNFSAPAQSDSPTASTILCPLLATTEKTVTNGYANIGTLADPMVYYMQCDNDGLYSNTCQWANTGTYTGLMVIMEAPIVISGTDDGTHPRIIGSVMAGTPVSTDITLSGNASVEYDQRVVQNLPANLQSILRTNSTDTVPGTWQQLSAN